MSYQESPAPITADAIDALFVAVVEVCENSFFAFVESCEPDRFAALVERLVPMVEQRAETPSPTPKRRGRRNGRAAESGLPEPPRLSEWVNASLTFTGSPFSGTMEVILPVRLARQLVASLLGLSQEVELHQVELLEHQVFDGIGEFANMICGAWLTDLSGSQAFNLEPPQVGRMPFEWSPLVDPSIEGEQGYRLCVDDLPWRIRVRPSND
jgi:chemotaxis phosphatase CheX-like protein